MLVFDVYFQKTESEVLENIYSIKNDHYPHIYALNFYLTINFQYICGAKTYLVHLKLLYR